MVKVIVAFRNFAKAPKNRLNFFLFFFANLCVCWGIAASEVTIEPPCLRLLQGVLVISYEVCRYCLVLQ